MGKSLTPTVPNVSSAVNSLAASVKQTPIQTPVPLPPPTASIVCRSCGDTELYRVKRLISDRILSVIIPLKRCRCSGCYQSRRYINLEAWTLSRKLITAVVLLLAATGAFYTFNLKLSGSTTLQLQSQPTLQSPE
jgi:hypothetical protein